MSMGRETRQFLPKKGYTKLNTINPTACESERIAIIHACTRSISGHAVLILMIVVIVVVSRVIG